MSISCNTQKEIKKSETIRTSSAGMEQVVLVSAKLVSIFQAADKFRVVALILNETGITSFSSGDTVSLYPNFIREEGEGMSKKNSENEHMASMQNLLPGSVFNATVKIRGLATKRHGLIMQWEK